MTSTSNSAIQPAKGPKRRIYRIPAPMLLEILRRVLQVPSDVQLVSFWPDRKVDPDHFTESDAVLCVSLEHPSFEPVAFKIPEIEMVEKKPVRAEVLAKKAKVAGA